MLIDNNTKLILSIERAIGDLKRGFPVIINDGVINLLVCSAEEITEGSFKLFKEPKILSTANRFNHIFKKDNYITSMLIDGCNFNDVKSICSSLVEDFKIDKEQIVIADQVHDSAINLIKLSQMIPILVVGEINELVEQDNFLVCHKNQIDTYKETVSLQIKQICKTYIQLKYGGKCQIIAYRPNIGGTEHYAIIVGDALEQEAPLIRIHSSCYTGDLLDSLVCDCHDQLHDAIKEMADNKDGGIILYMMQEGREIGLINKIRAYEIKSKGYDTVVANQMLGYEDDERSFEPSVKILEDLNINQIKLLTNNPKKINQVRKYGIDVLSTQSHVIKLNKYNKDYLKTKVRKMGHLIDEEDLV